MTADASTFPVEANMHPITLSLAAIEVLDLARMHLSMAKAQALCDLWEMHDFHECRATGLVASVRKVAPELTEQDQHDDLRPLWDTQRT